MFIIFSQPNFIISIQMEFWILHNIIIAQDKHCALISVAENTVQKGRKREFVCIYRCT